MNIEIKKINEVLSNIGNFSNKYKSVAYQNDGEYRPSTTNIYDVGDGLFLKETISPCIIPALIFNNSEQ